MYMEKVRLPRRNIVVSFSMERTPSVPITHRLISSMTLFSRVRLVPNMPCPSWYQGSPTEVSRNHSPSSRNRRNLSRCMISSAPVTSPGTRSHSVLSLKSHAIITPLCDRARSIPAGFNASVTMTGRVLPISVSKCPIPLGNIALNRIA